MKSEAQVQQEVRLSLAKQGIILWRNNVGACKDESGRIIRYGLANDSAQMNKTVKSGDLIGIKPVVITPDMVGMSVGLFTSIEVKNENWKYTGKGREAAQQKWIDIIKHYGGIAYFTNGKAPGA